MGACPGDDRPVTVTVEARHIATVAKEPSLRAPSTFVRSFEQRDAAAADSAPGSVTASRMRPRCCRLRDPCAARAPTSVRVPPCRRMLARPIDRRSLVRLLKGRYRSCAHAQRLLLGPPDVGEDD